MLLFLILLPIIATSHGFDEKAILTMKNVKCDINEKFVFANFSCFAKSYSRTVSTFNVKLYFKEPLNQVFVSAPLNSFEVG